MGDSKRPDDPVGRWVDDHPNTIAYIAFVVTVLLIIQIGELLQ